MDVSSLINQLKLFSLNKFLYDFANVVVGAWIFWAPFLLVYFLWKLWVYYIRSFFISKIEWVLLEIKIPRDMPKSPQAMELILSAFYQTRPGTFFDKYRDGFVTPWFSLEIVSVGGDIRFFIYTQKFFRKNVETEIYAQYPDVEVSEADDYTKGVFGSGLEESFDLGGWEFILGKSDAYPIKTYIDYKLDKLEAEEEQKNDPMTSLIEFLGSLRESEQAWLQILIRATKSKTWKEEGKQLVDEIMKRDEETVKKREKNSKEGKIDFSIMSVSPGERLIAETIERNVSKLGFDTVIRGFCVAPMDKFNKSAKFSLMGAMRQYNTLNLNEFKSLNGTSVDSYYVNLAKTRAKRKKRIILDAYRQRAGFYVPHERKTFVLNTEELATIFHFPGRVSETPTFARIEAKKGEPPIGLPI